MKRELREIVAALDAFAKREQLDRDDYQIFVRLIPEWDRFHLCFAVRAFTIDQDSLWFSLMRYLEKRWTAEPALLASINLTVSTFAQIEQGGYHGLSEEYERVEDLIATDSRI
jgi:hypothetical protein